MSDHVDWPSYLADFHGQRPGVTDGVLRRAVAPVGTPYDWMAGRLGGDRVLDLACGSGVLAGYLTGARWLGVDLSTAELALARAAGHGVLRADARRLPLASGSCDFVACSMALQLLPLEAALAEMARVLRPAGLVVATVPASGPLSAADRARYGALLGALGLRRLDYPNDAELADAAGCFTAAGLRLVEDTRERFDYPLDGPADGRRLLGSLYLPGVSPARLAAGTQVAEGWSGEPIGIALRLLVAVRGPSSGQRRPAGVGVG